MERRNTRKSEGEGNNWSKGEGNNWSKAADMIERKWGEQGGRERLSCREGIRDARQSLPPQLAPLCGPHTKPAENDPAVLEVTHVTSQHDKEDKVKTR